MRRISESEFHNRLVEVLSGLPKREIGSVTGPGRSGAIAAAYASHKLGVPFVAFGSSCPKHLGRLLIIDTARKSGETLRKAGRRYSAFDPIIVACYDEPPRLSFWYETYINRYAKVKLKKSSRIEHNQ